MKKKITIIINDDINELIRKGEIKNNYYNPKKLFDEIQIILLNNHKIENRKIFKQLFSCKKLDIIFFKTNIFVILINFFLFFFFGFQSYKSLVSKVEKFKPNILRSYTINFSIFFVYYIHCKTKIKFITSIHSNISSLTKKNKFINKIYWILVLPFIKKILSKASFLILKHKGLEKFVKKFNKSYQTIYTINNKQIKKKKILKTNKRVKIYNVGRQEKWKNPLLLCDKVFKEYDITLIGNGKIHSQIESKINNEKLDNIKLVKRIDNRILCKQIGKFDIFVHFSEYQEFPNTVMEAMLSGLPVIICKSKSLFVEEYYKNKSILLVDNNNTSLLKAIEDLKNSKKLRKKISQSGYKYAKNNFDPILMEKRELEVYRQFI